MTALKRVAIVVGETSGDILASGLMAELQARFPSCQFEGIGGPRMEALGFQSHFPMERLAVMGLVEPLKRLPELLSIRKNLRQRYSRNPPDLFIGVDAPDFNLSLEGALKSQGIKTVHYVSPSVWAWRQGRVKKIVRSVDLMLTLFPFEAEFYRKYPMRVSFVGHPLADELPLSDKRNEVRQQHGIDPATRILALLPGSRKSEVERLAPLFLEAATSCCEQLGDLHVYIPAANIDRYAELKLLLEDYPDLPVTLSQGNSHDVMTVSDVVVMASGTTTLEAMLLKKPMVIAYRMAGLSFWLLKKFVKVPYVGLPNLLAGRQLVPELLQDDATPESVSEAVMNFFQSNKNYDALVKDFYLIHQSLKRNASARAAEAVIALHEGRDEVFGE